jgi:Zn-dependent protease with chaperone function
VRRLCDALDRARIELRQRETYQDLYAALVTDYNGIVDALRAIGIEVAQPAGSDAWHWRYGGRSGQAPTIPAAYAAALNVYEELL